MRRELALVRVLGWLRMRAPGVAARAPGDLERLPLLCQKPSTIIGHVNLVAGLQDKGVLNLPESPRGPPDGISRALIFMLDNPHLFAISDSNIALREIYARTLDATPSRSLLWHHRNKVEHELGKALGHADRDKPIPKIEPVVGTASHAHNLLLRALVREGWIKGRLG